MSIKTRFILAILFAVLALLFLILDICTNTPGLMIISLSLVLISYGVTFGLDFYNNWKKNND